MTFNKGDYVEFSFYNSDGLATRAYGFVQEDCGDYCYVTEDENDQRLYSIDKEFTHLGETTDGLKVIKYPYWEN